MSYVTNCILSFCPYEEEAERMEQVNSFFQEKPFTSCQDKSLPEGWYGGSKFLETPIYIGAFNHFNLIDFITHLELQVRWEYPSNVQLITEEQDACQFKITHINIYKYPFSLAYESSYWNEIKVT